MFSKIRRDYLSPEVIALRCQVCTIAECHPGNISLALYRFSFNGVIANVVIDFFFNVHLGYFPGFYRELSARDYKSCCCGGCIIIKEDILASS